MRHLHFPVAILTHNGGLIIAAAKAHPEIATRLTAAVITAADTLCQKVAGDVTGQKNAKGELGNLTLAQQQNLTTLHQCMAQAAKTAKLAFPGGQTVKQKHQEFQTGPHEHNRPRLLSRSRGHRARLRPPTPRIWPRSNSKAGRMTRPRHSKPPATALAPPNNTGYKSISGAKDTTTQKNADAATLYDEILVIQNAADLQWPAADPANAGKRGEFLLGISPPDHGGNHTPPPAPPQTTPTTK